MLILNLTYVEDSEEHVQGLRFWVTKSKRLAFKLALNTGINRIDSKSMNCLMHSRSYGTEAFAGEKSVEEKGDYQLSHGDEQSGQSYQQDRGHVYQVDDTLAITTMTEQKVGARIAPEQGDK